MAEYRVNDSYLADIIRTFRNYKTLGEAALAQVSDGAIHSRLDPDANSIAVIVKHLAGNLRSRFADLLTTDGEKPDRDRDAEFEMDAEVSRDDVVAWWNDAWSVALVQLETLTSDDLARTIFIRGEPFLVVEALDRLATHTAYHVGQIVLLAKHYARSRWESLSIPKGRSRQHMPGTFKRGILPTRS